MRRRLRATRSSRICCRTSVGGSKPGPSRKAAPAQLEQFVNRPEYLKPLLLLCLPPFTQWEIVEISSYRFGDYRRVLKRKRSQLRASRERPKSVIQERAHFGSIALCFILVTILVLLIIFSVHRQCVDIVSAHCTERTAGSLIDEKKPPPIGWMARNYARGF